MARSLSLNENTKQRTITHLDLFENVDLPFPVSSVHQCAHKKKKLARPHTDKATITKIDWTIENITDELNTGSGNASWLLLRKMTHRSQTFTRCHIRHNMPAKTISTNLLKCCQIKKEKEIKKGTVQLKLSEINLLPEGRTWLPHDH